MHITDLARLVYEALTQQLGLTDVAELTNVYCNGSRYSIRRLPDTDVAMGHGISDHYPLTSFSVWQRVPETSITGLPRPFFSISIAERRSGVWAFGRGQHLQETATFEFPLNFSGVHIPERAAVVAAQAIIAAHNLFTTTAFEHSAGWEVERVPELDYSKP